MEHSRHWTATGGTLSHEQPPDAVMDRLLTGATEAFSDACRASDLYPRQPKTASHHVMSMITVAGDVADYTTTVLTAMEAKVAQEMKVAPANVDITASAGSVVLTINIGYDSAEEASTAATTMATAMSDSSSAATMLSTPTKAIAASAVASVGTPTSGMGSSAPPPSPTPPPPDAPPPKSDGLSVGAIAGIAVGGSVAVIAAVGGVIFMMMKSKKTVAPAKG